MDTSRITCGIFSQLDAQAMSYAVQAFDSLSGWTLAIFKLFIGVWAAYELGVKASLYGDFDIRKFLGQVFVFILCIGLLESSGVFFEWTYYPLREAMSGMTQMLVSVPATGVESAAYDGLLRTVETEVRRILGFGLAVMGQAGLTGGLMPLIQGIIIILPFLFVWAIFLAFLLEGTFKLLGMGAVSPVLIVCAAFKPSRAFAFGGLRIALNGVLTVVFAGVAMGFTLSVMHDFILTLPFDGEEFSGDVDKFLNGVKFYGVVLIGFISILFHLKAATLASNLSGASDGPGAAATVAGLGLAAVGAVKMAGAAATGKVGVAGIGGAKAVAAAKLDGAMQDSASIKAQLLRRITR